MADPSRGTKRKRETSSSGGARRAGEKFGTNYNAAAEKEPVPSTSRPTSKEDPPRDINVIAFAEHRSREIRTLLDALSARKPNKRVFQQLPRHMRRRAMSYNIKRLPKNLRGLAEKEASKAKTPKRHRKKYRKRPRNKKTAYAKRQSVNKWLETHIWHAKRFCMTTMWNYRLADFPNDKGYRAAYRASAEECLMTDLSYFVCLELEASEELLLAGVQKFASPDIGRTFAYRDYRDGHSEGSCMLYHPEKYPTGYIGPVRFQWLPDFFFGSATRKLHIWCHPSIYPTLCQEMVKAFAMDPVSDDISPETVEETTSSANEAFQAMNIESGAMEDTEAEECSTDVAKEGGMPASELITADADKLSSMSGLEYLSASGVRLRILKDRYVRFRLTGEKSTKVLKHVLKSVADFDLVDDGSGKCWWQSCFRPDGVRELNKRQRYAWEFMEDYPSLIDVRAGAILSLLVRDPRLFLPKRKLDLPHIPLGGSSNSVGHATRLPDRSSRLSFSFLWNDDACRRVKEEKISDQEMNRLRSNLPAPGYGAGWDMILPAGWSMSFWIPLVYSGARVGGLRELDTVGIQAANMVFPSDYPDADAGVAYGKDIRMRLEGKFQRYPPNKRPNFLKLGTAAPFHCPWQLLVNEWKRLGGISPATHGIGTGSFGSFFVIRNLKLLVLIGDMISGKILLDSLMHDHKVLMETHSEGLFAVTLSLATGGSAALFSTISIPFLEDYEKLLAEKHYKGPSEPVHADPYIRNPAKERRKLQVQKILNDPEKVVDASSRLTIGYVIKGGFSFHAAHNVGLGYCSLLGFLRLMQDRMDVSKQILQKKSIQVLVRGPHSFQYNFADMEVLCSQSSLI